MKVFPWVTIFLFLSTSCVTPLSVEERKGWLKIEAHEDVSTLSYASCFADEDHFHVFSGIDEYGKGPLSNVGYSYNLKRKTWAKWSNDFGPPPLQNFASSQWDDDIYVFGGQIEDEKSGTNDFYRYSLDQNRWTKLEVPPSVDGRWRAASAMSKKYFLLYGGKGSKADLSTALYDVKQNIWIVMDTPSTVGTRVSGVLSLYDDQALVIGGFIDSVPQNSAFMLNISTQKWKPLQGYPLGARVNPKYLTSSSKLYMLGGAVDYEGQDFGGIYDFIENSWTIIPKIEGFADLKGFEIALLGNEGLLLLGGRNVKTNRYSDKIYLYSFASKNWKDIKIENSPRGTVGTCLVTNTKQDVFVLGGIHATETGGLMHLEHLWMLPSRIER